MGRGALGGLKNAYSDDCAGLSGSKCLPCLVCLFRHIFLVEMEETHVACGFRSGMDSKLSITPILDSLYYKRV